MDQDPLDLWQTFHHHPDDTQRAETREQLILHYTGLVRYVAWRAGARLHSNIDREDLFSYGMFGLIDAIDGYRPETGVPFKHYAIPRIHGSIIDELRTLDWVPRSMRARERWLTKATEQLEQRTGRLPTPQELTTELGWAPAEVRTVQAQIESRQMRYYLEPGKEGSEEDQAGKTDHSSDRPDLALPDPDLELELDITRQLLAVAVGRLPERERAVAAMYWRGGVCPRCSGAACRRCDGYGMVASLTLGEIGGVLGISESWACQLYTNAATRLREDLAQLR